MRSFSIFDSVETGRSVCLLTSASVQPRCMRSALSAAPGRAALRAACSCTANRSRFCAICRVSLARAYFCSRAMSILAYLQNVALLEKIGETSPDAQFGGWDEAHDYEVVAGGGRSADSHGWGFRGGQHDDRDGRGHRGETAGSVEGRSDVGHGGG